MAKLDTSYRSMSLETLNALRTSCLMQLKNIEAVGQSHSLNGRSTSLASSAEIADRLASVESAIAWKNTVANNGNKGYASRYSSSNL